MSDSFLPREGNREEECSTDTREVNRGFRNGLQMALCRFVSRPWCFAELDFVLSAYALGQIVACLWRSVCRLATGFAARGMAHRQSALRGSRQARATGEAAWDDNVFGFEENAGALLCQRQKPCACAQHVTGRRNAETRRVGWRDVKGGPPASALRFAQVRKATATKNGEPKTHPYKPRVGHPQVRWLEG
jgi:hypothetical protein